MKVPVSYTRLLLYSEVPLIFQKIPTQIAK